MTPQARGVVPPATVEAIEAARGAVADAEADLKRVTVQALVDGASYPELHRATGIAVSTLQRWVKELGAIPAGTAAKQSSRARDALHIKRAQAMLGER